MPNTSNHTQPTVKQLRRRMPTRPVTLSEAKQVAELQANHFRQLVGDNSPNFEASNISELPRIKLYYDTDIAASGSTQWHSGAWRITVRSDEPLVRQRFTLAHEFKHILDAPKTATTYATLNQRVDRDQQVENICDHFAACLLMPKRWVKRLWGEGIHDLGALADTFDVSTVAMRRRLTNLGLIDQHARPRQRPERGLSGYQFSARPKYYRTKTRYALVGEGSAL